MDFWVLTFPGVWGWKGLLKSRDILGETKGGTIFYQRSGPVTVVDL